MESPNVKSLLRVSEDAPVGVRAVDTLHGAIFTIPMLH